MNQSSQSCLDLVAADVRGPSTDATLATTRFIIQWIYMPILVLFGVLANLVNMIVLTRKEMFSSTNYYLAGLACCDTLYLVGGMLCTMPKLLPLLALWHPFMFMTSYLQVSTTYVNDLSVLIICSFTVERFIVIRWPMKGRVWCTREKAKRIVLFAVLFTLLIELPNLVFYTPALQAPAGLSKLANTSRLACHNDSQSDAFACEKAAELRECKYWKKAGTQLARQHELLIAAMAWVSAVLFAFLPLILLFVLNGYLIRSVLVAKTERCQMMNKNTAVSLVVPSQQYMLLASSCKSSITPQLAKVKRDSHNERKVTIMLIAVVLLFLACHLPNAFGLLYTTALQRQFNGQIPKDLNNRRLIMNNIFNALIQLNAAANFILYSFLSKKFNQTMRRLLTIAMARLCRPRGMRTTEVTASTSSLNMATVCSERTSIQTKVTIIRQPHTAGENGCSIHLSTLDAAGPPVSKSSCSSPQPLAP